MGPLELITFKEDMGVGSHDGIGVFIRTGRDYSSPLWGHINKVTIWKPRIGLKPGNKSAGTVILDFPVCRTVRNKYLMFQPPGLWYFVIAGWTKSDFDLLFFDSIIPVIQNYSIIITFPMQHLP